VEAASATDEGASGEELLVERSSGSEEPLGTPVASSGPGAVCGHVVQLHRTERQTSITSISIITVDVVGKSAHWHELDEVAWAVLGAQGDPDATDGEED